MLLAKNAAVVNSSLEILTAKMTVRNMKLIRLFVNGKYMKICATRRTNYLNRIRIAGVIKVFVGNLTAV